MASLVVTVAPASEPVTLAEARAHLRVSSTAEDAMITGLIVAARRAVEAYCARGLITQTVRLRLDAFPAGCLRLPWGRTASVTSVAYVDADGDTQALTGHQSDLDAVPARLAPAYGEDWPATREQLAAVTVTYVVGAAAADEDVRSAIMLILGDLYANREAQVVGVPIITNPTAKMLLRPHELDLLGLELEQ